MQHDDEHDSAAETLTSHLAELRNRIINALWIITIGSGLSFYFCDKIFEAIRAPIAPYLQDGGFVFLNPADKFTAYIKVSIFAGVILTCPFWLYQAWRFVAPGLYAKEKKYSLVFILFGSFQFFVGVAFVYFLVFPMAFKFLLSFGGTTDKPMITIDEYMSFFTSTTLMFGAVFELPLVLVILGILGIIDQQFLREKRRYAVVLLAVVSALVTPPDIMSMLMLLVPLMLLYEMSILILGYFLKPQRNSNIRPV